MKHLKQFSTQAAYDAAKSGLVLPNVSLINENNKVEYNPNSPVPPVPPTPTHDYIEIGGIKWATMNIGANSVTDTGLFFQWGDTQGYTADQVGDGEGQKYFDFEDYKYAELNTEGGGEGSGSGSGSGSGGGSYTMTKYNSSDGLTVLQASDDAATAAWGVNWRMPTYEEFNSLKENTTSAWTNDYQDSGVEGVVLTDKTDSSKVLFFPAAGYAGDGEINDTYYANCWLSSVYSYKEGYARYLQSYYGDFRSNEHWRSIGLNVRPILDE